MEEAGEVKSRRWHMIFEAGEYPEHPAASSDNTHLRYEGAVKYGSLIAKGLKELGGVYSDLILDEIVHQ
ncbi:MAG: GDSL family lipase, partial [Lachnospiraceae bacterium]|nr:GDSL family lipase [Lachnospiraceae bacterium]